MGKGKNSGKGKKGKKGNIMGKGKNSGKGKKGKKGKVMKEPIEINCNSLLNPMLVVLFIGWLILEIFVVVSWVLSW